MYVTVKKPVWLTIDIEKGGDDLETPILAVGLVVGDEDGNLLEESRWCIAADEKCLEPRCKREFWDKQGDLFDFLQQNALPATEIWPSLAAYLDKIYAQYSVKHVVSDNPAYDVGHTDYYLKKYAKRIGLRYCPDGSYHSISDPTEQFKGLPVIAQQWVSTKSRQYLEQFHCRPHDPLCDARGIYAQMVFVTRYRKNKLSCQNYSELALEGLVCAGKGVVSLVQWGSCKVRDMLFPSKIVRW
jgi:hypothetical protein